MKNLDRLSKKKLGDILIDEGMCTRAQVEQALVIERKKGDRLHNILLDTNHDLTETDIARAIAKQFNLPFIMASHYKVNNDAIELIQRSLLYEATFIPIDIIGNVLVIVMGGLMSAELVTQIESETGKEVFIYVSTAGDVLSALQVHAPYDPKAEVAEGSEDFDWAGMFDEADQELRKDE